MFLGSVFMITLTCILAGCQAINPLPRYGLGNQPAEESQIYKLMKWHSGRVEVYKDFRTVFTARAVYISGEIHRVAVDWEARSRLMSPEEREGLFKSTLKGGENSLHILLGFYTPQDDLNDLDQSESAWIPYLKNPDGTITRATCYGIGGEEGKIYMRFLEWDLSWSRLYLLCFPITPDVPQLEGDFLTLVISGPRGQGEIRLRTVPPRAVK
jgi:hypothetical protein